MDVIRTTKPGSSSLTGKEPKEPDGEGFRDATSTNNRVENGIWVRSCNKAGFGDDVSATSKNLSEKGLASGKFGPMVDGNGESLDVSEMNGVSSLLEMQQSGRYPGLDSVLNVIDKNENRGYGKAADDKKDAECGGNSEDEMYENEFEVGDFIWGKIKSHPWWPGRVYDPLDASEYAKKVKHGGDKILVAYFGDETFAWCNPSQLKPFHENFVEMSSQSTSKNFVNAVEKALEEVGRSVDLRLTCSCVPRDNLFGFGRYLAVNAGVKDGLLVPEDGVEKFMNDLFDPQNVFASVKALARVCRIDNVFDHAVLKSSLSAFYRAKGGIQLPVYHEAQPIPGLEDEAQKGMTDRGAHNNVAEGGTFAGPVEEDWFSSSPRGSEFSRDSQNSLQKSQLHRRRKRKSIAKIISDSPNTEDEKDGSTRVEKSAGKTVSRKKKRSIQSDLTGEEAIGVVGKPSPSGIRKRRGRDKATEEVGSSHKVLDLAEVEASSGRPSASSVITKSKASEADTKGSRTKGVAQASSGSKRSIGGEESDTKGVGDSVSRQRKRKKDEASECPPVTGDDGISNPEADVSGLKKRKITSPSVWKTWKQEDTGIKNDANQGNTEEAAPSDDAKGKGTIDNLGLSRERKKSWYLSPPFTDLSKAQKTKIIEAEEAVSRGSHDLDGELSKEQSSVQEMHTDLANQTPKGRNFTTDEAASEVLCRMRAAACDPLNVGGINRLDEVLGFVSELRSSGSNLESNIKPRRGRKKKIPQESESTPVPASDVKSQKKEETKRAKEDPQSESKKAVVAATLLVTFGPGCSLPTKNDLLRIYGPFGALNEETDMLYNNRCARVAFSTTSQAEEALKHSQQSNPFEATHVNFRLRYPASSTVKKKTAAPVNRSELYEMVQKLEKASTMLKSEEEESVSDLKSRVEGEIRGVIQKLVAMVGSGD
ncbi:PWWP domain-containing protein 3 [Linum grandiflorum]